MLLRRALLALFLFGAAAAPAAASAESCLTPNAEITGKLTKVAYVHPGNGYRTTLYVVELDRPTCAYAENNEDKMQRFENVRRIQLSAVDAGKIKHLVGKNVTVRGSLAESPTVYYVTPLFIDVKSVEAAKKA